MNTAPLKTYAPLARKAFIAAVGRRAEMLGLNPEHPATVQQQGDVLLINGQPHPARIAEQRRKLAARIQQQSYASVIEALAYTWFNRLVAIRYMELHGYLDHGYRVLSHPDGSSQPEILEHLARIELPGLDRQQALEWKAAGNRDEDLYRAVLLAQCHALHTAMPFLFEAIDDATELLLPDGLLRTDSLIRSLVTAIDEASWQDVEIIGWLYQFYISEKKDQVIGKVVKSEDIPAATQLFTPNWIVKYMVQNSLGAQWLATYPDSGLKAQMAYYIEPAEQTETVRAQLAAITPASLDPEALTLIDPACGSGHILVEAYELFKAIYLERGYVLRDIPKLILEKNLYGLDIDDRAAQLTGFALMMKARADDRRLFERGVQLNVMALQDSASFDAERLVQGVKLADYGLTSGDLTALKGLFEHATTFGSLIHVPEALAAKLAALRRLSETDGQDLFVLEALAQLAVLTRQAEMLAARYDSVVANPPYMGGKYYDEPLKDFVHRTYPAGKSDLYGAFAQRNVIFARKNGRVGMITIPNWMFLSSFEELRNTISSDAPISTLVHNGRGVWGSDFGSCSYVLLRGAPHQFCGRFLRLFDKPGSVASNEELQRRFRINTRFSISNAEFSKIPGNPIAYWAGASTIRAFSEFPSLYDFARPRQGLATTKDEIFLRQWHEPSVASFVHPSCVSYETRRSGKWFALNKGGNFRKWFGNNQHVINYENDGETICRFIDSTPGARVKSNGRVINKEKYFQQGVTWSSVSIGSFSIRFSPPGFVFSHTGPMCFASNISDLYSVLALGCSPILDYFLRFLSPDVHYSQGPLGKLPINVDVARRTTEVVRPCIDIAMNDWNAYERSWDFQSLPILVAVATAKSTLESCCTAWITQNRATIAQMRRLEEKNNRVFIDAYGLQDELTSEVPIEQITLTVNPAYRYGGKLTEEEQWTRFREDTMQELVSYAIGCMMGRYSLDAPGLIYAHSGNEGFDPSRYTRFPADADGILPLTDTEWFEDDACKRLVEFISVAWDATHLEENLRFLAENLSPKTGEASRDTLRRYLCDRFFKDHLQTYKKRPIYWLFSSGKEKAFQCLVYLHRYNAGTLSRMRMDYVVPLQSRLQARIDQLDQDIAASTSSATTTRLRKQQDSLRKQLEELRRFDEKLRHAADQRITLDLDDGVKVNYGKFGDLLAEVKAVTGGDNDE
ncbi:BREX-1 system adenine-specific DNA-methyltransferase PglX [Nevskia ramosa]|uniref:BREX-1 system adenine-specific DNA-methyltransferase PglX n=1 Tax=Nevskia ramosa TaxID=64002 RepID=UPI0003B4B77A|nr:BREX-1 system adenine-specific DNA-methyltransferase PglX [Nevskia ramosa]